MAKFLCQYRYFHNFTNTTLRSVIFMKSSFLNSYIIFGLYLQTGSCLRTLPEALLGTPFLSYTLHTGGACGEVNISLLITTISRSLFLLLPPKTQFLRGPCQQINALSTHPDYQITSVTILDSSPSITEEFSNELTIFPPLPFSLLLI